MVEREALERIGTAHSLVGAVNEVAAKWREARSAFQPIEYLGAAEVFQSLNLLREGGL